VPIAAARFDADAEVAPSRVPLDRGTAMALFAVVTIPADIQHALSSHQPLSWLVSAVVYAALVAYRRFPLCTLAIAVFGSVVLMADGMAYPQTLPAVFYALYLFALGASPGRTLAVGVTVKAALLSADDDRQRLAAQRAAAIALSEHINASLLEPPLVE